MGNAFHGQKYEWPTCNIVQYILCPVIVHCGTTPILTPITPDLIVLQSRWYRAGNDYIKYTRPTDAFKDTVTVYSAFKSLAFHEGLCV